jgi:large subunit ribosomal protein L3
MKFILGKKLEMTQIFKDDGTVVPVTKVLAGPCVITQIKNKETDGYFALQMGFDSKKTLNKPLAGHLKDLGNSRFLQEVRLEKENKDAKRGDIINLTIFTEGDIVQVSGTSKGKGFQGVVKRHGFAGKIQTHGNKDQLRMPGSLGAKGPARVFKGMRMGGRMGGDRITVKNLEIIKIDQNNNILFIKGAVPGTRNTLLEISA